MAILLPTEQRSTKGRLIHAGIITLLLLGGVTMVYPFLVMLSGSVRSGIDEAELDLVPEYLVDDEALYRKFLEFKYNGDVAALNRAHRTTHFSFAEANPPNPSGWTPPLRPDKPVGPEHFIILGGIQGERTVPANLRRIRNELIDRYDGDIADYISDGGAPTPSWLTVVVSPPRWFDRRYDFPPGPLLDAYSHVRSRRPTSEWQIVSLSGHFLDTMIWPSIGRGDDAKTAVALSPGSAWSDFALPLSYPLDAGEHLKQAWSDYVRNEVNPAFVMWIGKGYGPESNNSYRTFLAAIYDRSIDELNQAWSTEYEDFSSIDLPVGRWLRGIERQDYQRFLDTQPIQELGLVDPSRNWLEDDGHPSVWEHFAVEQNSGPLRRQFASRNYINVWDELAGEGRALWNTLIYCTLSIVLALLINPLAAYGLSRFKLRGGYKALLILMATMAFPPMVTLIPQFIALRNLGLMNTFVALLLPLIANGYLIFLLKGFFDSLPQELYEAGTIDGASELRMFFQIAMALSKPILAVVALQTFTAAYTMFLYALLVAPDRDMWLISVWLFQYQERASSSGVFASVVIASVPTLLLFLLVQRTIMRGIVVPTEK
ncbi:MAG: ABC transporter permease subunit [Planctomycetota bacterium]